MEELIAQVVQKTGLSPDRARSAVETVVSFLKKKLPAPLSNQLEQAISGGGSGGKKEAKKDGSGSEKKDDGKEKPPKKDERISPPNPTMLRVEVLGDEPLRRILGEEFDPDRRYRIEGMRTPKLSFAIGGAPVVAGRSTAGGRSWMTARH